jgi:hypothetical protein
MEPGEKTFYEQNAEMEEGVIVETYPYALNLS